jgi:hypothetical protein
MPIYVPRLCSTPAVRNPEKQHLGVDSCRSVCHATEENIPPFVGKTGLGVDYTRNKIVKRVVSDKCQTIKLGKLFLLLHLNPTNIKNRSATMLLTCSILRVIQFISN